MDPLTRWRRCIRGRYPHFWHLDTEATAAFRKPRYRDIPNRPCPHHLTREERDASESGDEWLLCLGELQPHIWYIGKKPTAPLPHADYARLRCVTCDRHMARDKRERAGRQRHPRGEGE